MNEVESIVINLNGYKNVTSSVNKINKLSLENNINVINFFDNLLSIEKEETFILMTLIIKKRKLYDIEYFNSYENWLYRYVNTWGKCDAYCYRVINPMIQKYPELYTNIINWAKSKLIYVRRASLVCFIISKNEFEVNYDIDKIFILCDMLKEDKHIHIQKALGWVLKYTYLTYPKETIEYLNANVTILSRTTFRYALEKMPKVLKDKMMKL